MQFVYLQIKLNIHMQQTYFVVLMYTNYEVTKFFFRNEKKSSDNYCFDRIFAIGVSMSVRCLIN